jgi:hypothetical protein
MVSVARPGRATVAVSRMGAITVAGHRPPSVSSYTRRPRIHSVRRTSSLACSNQMNLSYVCARVCVACSCSQSSGADHYYLAPRALCSGRRAARACRPSSPSRRRPRSPCWPHDRRGDSPLVSSDWRLKSSHAAADEGRRRRCSLCSRR